MEINYNNDFYTESELKERKAMKKIFKFKNYAAIPEIDAKMYALKINHNIDSQKGYVLVSEMDYNRALIICLQIIKNSSNLQESITHWFDEFGNSYILAATKEEIENQINAYLNNILTEVIIKEVNTNWKTTQDNVKLENLGIGLMNYAYLEVNKNQNIKEEYPKILEFLKSFMNDYSTTNNIPLEDLTLEFINYGKTELVYVLTEKSGKRLTLLIKQPAVKTALILNEINNLKELQKIDNNVVAPINTYQSGDQILYITPYIHQARCVASYDFWGIYIPEPFYRFVPFTKEQESIVNASMLAKLINYYDFDKHEGICACKLGGGDFMLEKGWENEIPTINNTLNNLYFIAAREKVKCSFEDYIEIIKNEFTKTSINENQDKLIINKRGRVAMSIKDVENGIELGKKLIKEKVENKLKK